MTSEVLTREEIAILQSKCYSMRTVTFPDQSDVEVPIVSCTSSSYFDAQQFARLVEQEVLKRLTNLIISK